MAIQVLKYSEIEIFGEQYDYFASKTLFIIAAFLCGFGYCFDMVLRSVYISYATNSYSIHSLLSTIQIVNTVITIAAQVMFARLSDYFGRLHLFCIAIVSYIMGTIIQSQVYNVHTYAAKSAFYKLGTTRTFLMLILIISAFYPKDGGFAIKM